MKTALLFPGQGAQFIGMGQSIIQYSQAAQTIFNQLPNHLQQLIIEGPMDELSDTRHTQPAIFGISMAILAALSKKQINIAGAAGLSLGEYSALCAAGSISFEQGLNLVTQRAILMHEAIPSVATTMLAVIGQSDAQLQQYIVEFENLYPSQIIMIANYNTAQQQVVAGASDAIQQFKKFLRIHRIKSSVLNVSGPFHTSLLSQASQQFLPYLEKITFQHPKYPVYSNVDGKAYQNEANFSQQLAQQISHPVYFYQMIQQMVRDGYECFIEIGPGTVLSKFVTQIVPDVQVLAINNIEDLQGDILC